MNEGDFTHEHERSFQDLFESLNTEQLTAPSFDQDWSVKDIVNHLWGWQQVTLARLNAGVQDGEPAFPDWLTSFPGNWDADADQTNAWIVKEFRSLSWAEVHQNWMTGYQNLLESAAKIPEMDLLDGDRYPWMHGYSLAAVLLSTYAHHQEHLDFLVRWRQDQKI
jgi:hypothetical protein